MTKTITGYIDIFNESNQKSGTRYATFDLCYGYFNSNRKNLIGNNMEKSCYVLWSYLASWGMLRGSSFLLQMNPSYLISLVEYINSNEGDIMFDIDVNSYVQNSDVILSTYDKIKSLLTPKTESKTIPSKTLVTKIMLGVFGSIPAYDRYFIETFKTKGVGFCSPNLSPQSIECISAFYAKHKPEIDNLIENSKVKDFYGNETGLKYPIAKIIDMYGFQKGMTDEENKDTKKLEVSAV